MSWSINLIGKPENLIEALNKHSDVLTDKSKEEYDEVLPHMIGIIKMNYSVNAIPVMQLSANGHGYSTNGVQQHSQCHFELKPLPGSLV